MDGRVPTVGTGHPRVPVPLVGTVEPLTALAALVAREVAATVSAFEQRPNGFEDAHSWFTYTER